MSRFVIGELCKHSIFILDLSFFFCLPAPLRAWSGYFFRYTKQVACLGSGESQNYTWHPTSLHRWSTDLCVCVYKHGAATLSFLNTYLVDSNNLFAFKQICSFISFLILTQCFLSQCFLYKTILLAVFINPFNQPLSYLSKITLSI